MYSKERAKQVVKKDIKYIPAGIHENVALKDARMSVSPTGRNFIEVVFEKDGATLTHTEWEPKRSSIDTNETFQTKEDNQFSRILQILSCFYNDENLVFNATTFKEWATEVVRYLVNADKTKLVRIKVVYNDRGYTTLPQYAVYTFIEPMTVTDSKIVELGIDKFTRPVAADKEEIVTNPLDSVAQNDTIENSDNELPF